MKSREDGKKERMTAARRKDWRINGDLMTRVNLIQ
jgi:hypothetical protein